jgi:hypothetical protein
MEQVMERDFYIEKGEKLEMTKDSLHNFGIPLEDIENLPLGEEILLDGQKLRFIGIKEENYRFQMLDSEQYQ